MLHSSSLTVSLHFSTVIGHSFKAGLSTNSFGIFEGPLTSIYAMKDFLEFLKYLKYALQS